MGSENMSTKKKKNKKEGERNRNENTNRYVKEAKLPSSDGIGPDNELEVSHLNEVRENVNKKEKTKKRVKGIEMKTQTKHSKKPSFQALMGLGLTMHWNTDT